MSPIRDGAVDRRTDGGRRPPRVVVWGTYDTGKPRTRNLLSGLRTCGWEIIECHADIWGGIEDKTQISKSRVKLFRSVRWLFAYPVLVARYLRLPKHDLVLVGYMGQLDVLVLWMFARLRRVPVVWDALISLYNTAVNERAYFGRRHPFAVLLYAMEWLGTRAVDRLLANTMTATEYFVEKYGIPRERVCSLLVGVETHAFPPRPVGRSPHGPVRVLFYGTLIPLHGIRYILQAARLASHLEVEWEIIGSGHEGELVEGFLSKYQLDKVTWSPWVPYEQLAARIHAADIGLGIFGDSTQARWSIPNKVFQLMACGIPVITRDSPGARELMSEDMPGIYLVNPEDPEAILRAVLAYSSERRDLYARVLRQGLVRKFDKYALGKRLGEIITPLITRTE